MASHLAITEKLQSWEALDIVLLAEVALLGGIHLHESGSGQGRCSTVRCDLHKFETLNAFQGFGCLFVLWFEVFAMSTPPEQDDR